MGMPTQPKSRFTIVAEGNIQCNASDWRVSTGVLFGLGDGLELVWSCSKATVTVEGGRDLGSMQFMLPAALATQNSTTTLAVNIDPGDAMPVGVCINGQQLVPSNARPLMQSAAQLQSAAKSEGAGLLRKGISIGSTKDARKTMRQSVQSMWLFIDVTVPCTDVAAPQLAALMARASRNQLPAIAGLALDPAGGEIVVGQTLKVRASASDPDGDATRLRATFYGVPMSGCTAAACADEVAEVSGGGGETNSSTASTVQLEAAVRYSLPGRYVVVVEAGDGWGRVARRDFEVVVRKVGDVRRSADFRHTSMVTAQQVGPLLEILHAFFFLVEGERREVLLLCMSFHCSLAKGAEYPPSIVSVNDSKCAPMCSLGVPFTTLPIDIPGCMSMPPSWAGTAFTWM
jgi:hypothetical protein